VIPSIPGFGLSGPTRQRGWDIHRVARAWAELMHRLGYDRYGAQGGDWGSAISRARGAVAPDRVVGVHLNYLPMPPNGEHDLSEQDHARLMRVKKYLAQRPGHVVLQATRPQTLAYALTDSPVGQLAWIAENFTEWTDPRSTITIDRLLTNVMLYWLTGTAGSSARLHRESHIGPLPCRPPVGVAVFAHGIVLSVHTLTARAYTVKRWTSSTAAVTSPPFGCLTCSRGKSVHSSATCGDRKAGRQGRLRRRAARSGTDSFISARSTNATRG
jgi:pimeloyl-ACP methyl ester carboxylesterase